MGEPLQFSKELLTQAANICAACTQLKEIASGLHGNVQLSAAQKSHIDLTAALVRHGEDILHHVGVKT